MTARNGLALLLLIAALIFAGISMSTRSPLKGRWMVIYNTPSAILQFNLDSIKTTDGITELWLRDDIIMQDRAIVVTALTRVQIDCASSTVQPVELIGYDAALVELVRGPTDPTRITSSTLAAFAFVCPNSPLPQVHQHQPPVPLEKPEQPSSKGLRLA